MAEQSANGLGCWFPVPNHSGGYLGILRQWWEFCGLGKRSLLVSESTEARQIFEKQYPDMKFISTDYFTELNNEPCDIVWNLYLDPPKELANQRFDSAICSATLEHLIDPIGVLKRLVLLLNLSGHLYLHTVSPLFGYHDYPRDYIRFFKDWFEDLPMVIPELELIKLLYAKKSGHIFSCYRLRQ